MFARFISVGLVWIAALVGAILVASLAGATYLAWIAVVLAGAILLAFALQLALRQRVGLVTRLMASTAGAFGILVVTTVLLVIAHPAVPLLG